MLEPHDRLCVLADSLPGVIRWRFCDYEQLLKKQLRLLTPPLRLVWPPHGDVVAPGDDVGRGYASGIAKTFANSHPPNEAR
jgi:hypothetical protein